MVKARDIMSRRILSLRASASIEDAALALVAHGIGGAPVLDPDGRVVGIVSRTDLADPERRANAPGDRDRTGSHPCVADLMLPALAIVRDSAPAIEAARLMVREEVQRVLVTDEVGRLVGIVTATDVLRAVKGTASSHPGTGVEVPDPALH